MVGSGKSQAIYNILFGNFDKKGKKISDGIVDFSEPMIIYERKGEDFLGCLFRRKKDLLFDPRDIDCIRWNIFQDMLNEDNEIEETMVDFFVSSICPISDSKSAHFEEQGSSVIKALLLAVTVQELLLNDEINCILNSLNNSFGESSTKMGEVKKLDTLMWGVGKVLKDKNNLFEEK